MTCVIDASVLVDVLLGRSPPPNVARVLAAGDACAPEVLDAEVLSAIARLERGGTIDARRAEAMLRAHAAAPVRRVPHRGLLLDAWRRRGNLSTYDALYVALAARLGCPLMTTDRRLAAAPGLDIPITLLPPA